MQTQAENELFENQKFFYPPEKFFTPLFLPQSQLLFEEKVFFSFLHQSDQISSLKKGGKKILREVKNFWFFKSSFLASICTKKHPFILKTREDT